MKSFFSICAGLVIFLGLTAIFASSALSDSSTGSPPMERWTGKVKGMAEGTWVLNTWHSETKENELIVKGLVNMSLNSVSGGYGRGNCEGTIVGKIKDGILKADFLGRGRIIEGEGDVFGGMSGELDEKTGNGTYRLVTPVGNYTGEWSLQKDE